MPNGLFTRLQFMSVYKTQAAIAQDLGASRTVVNRWLTGVAAIPEARSHQIHLAYERTQYEVLRQAGLGTRAAASLRGRSPDLTAQRLQSLENMVEKWRVGAVVKKLEREDLDWASLDRATQDSLLEEAEEDIRESMRRKNPPLDVIDRY